jgi:hypothetical protein
MELKLSYLSDSGARPDVSSGPRLKKKIMEKHEELFETIVSYGCHCCQVPDRVVCKCLKKIRPNEKKILHFLKSCLLLLFMVKLTQNFLALKLYFRKSCEDNCFKTQYSMRKNTFSLKYFFLPVFGRFCKNSAAVRPPNFSSQSFFSTAGFELFCRIFGRLATVMVAEIDIILDPQR